jgi:hypothetical protein
MTAIRQMLTNPNAQAQPTTTGASRINSGGLAGVASKAQGHTIKVVNDQVDYALWEFYYDPSKDVKHVLPGAAGTGAVPGAGTNTFNRTVTNANRPIPTIAPAPTAAPAATQPPPEEFQPNPNPNADTPPPDEPTNPEDTNPNDTPSEPPQ